MLKKKDWGKIEPFLLRGQQLCNLLEKKEVLHKKKVLFPSDWLGIPLNIAAILFSIATLSRIENISVTSMKRQNNTIGNLNFNELRRRPRTKTSLKK